MLSLSSLKSFMTHLLFYKKHLHQLSTCLNSTTSNKSSSGRTRFLKVFHQHSLQRTFKTISSGLDHLVAIVGSSTATSEPLVRRSVELSEERKRLVVVVNQEVTLGNSIAADLHAPSTTQTICLLPKVFNSSCESVDIQVTSSNDIH